jgi:hypothetical protein
LALEKEAFSGYTFLFNAAPSETAMGKKRHQTIFILALAVVIATAAFLYYRHRAFKPKDLPLKNSPYRVMKQRAEIRGFQFDGHFEGRKIISIRASKFRIEKRKLGHFTLGLMNVARFQDAVIDLYGQRQEGRSENPVSKALHEQGEPSSPAPMSVTFKNAFKKEALPILPVKRISSVTLEPVRVHLHDGETLLTAISAASATLRLKNRDMLFKGQVRVSSGNRSLTTDRLSLSPDATLQAKGHCVLRTPGKTMEREGLGTDIFLNVR